MKMCGFAFDFMSGVSVKDYGQDFYERRERIKQEKIFFTKPKELENIKGE